MSSEPSGQIFQVRLDERSGVRDAQFTLAL